MEPGLRLKMPNPRTGSIDWAGHEYSGFLLSIGVLEGVETTTGLALARNVRVEFTRAYSSGSSSETISSMIGDHMRVLGPAR